MKPQLTREEIVRMLENRLRGDITQSQLANWADEQFEKWDADELSYDERHRDAIDEAIFRLQDCDSSDSPLTEADVRDLIVTLTTP